MYGVPHIATGDMLREMRELDTPAARELRAVLDRGDLVNDELMIDLIRERLSRGDTVVGFVLDGFPRTLAQAEALDELLRELGRDLDIVFDLQVPKREMLLERAYKIADHIMTQPRTTRRLTTQIVRRPWKHRIVNDLDGGFGIQMFGHLAKKRAMHARSHIADTVQYVVLCRQHYRERRPFS